MQMFLQRTINELNIPYEEDKGLQLQTTTHFLVSRLITLKHDIYKVKGKEFADEEHVPVKVPIRHPLAGFTRPVTSLECGTIDIYHRLRCPRKAMSKYR